MIGRLHMPMLAAFLALAGCGDGTALEAPRAQTQGAQGAAVLAIDFSADGDGIDDVSEPVALAPAPLDQPEHTEPAALN